jgi:hypothetical protein
MVGYEGEGEQNGTIYRETETSLSGNQQDFCLVPFLLRPDEVGNRAREKGMPAGQGKWVPNKNL